MKMPPFIVKIVNLCKGFSCNVLRFSNQFTDEILQSTEGHLTAIMLIHTGDNSNIYGSLGLESITMLPLS